MHAQTSNRDNVQLQYVAQAETNPKARAKQDVDHNHRIQKYPSSQTETQAMCEWFIVMYKYTYEPRNVLRLWMWSISKRDISKW